MRSPVVVCTLKSARLEHDLLINFRSYKFEMRKFAGSQDAAHRRKSKPRFLLSAISAFFVSLRFDRRRILSCAR